MLPRVLFHLIPSWVDSGLTNNDWEKAIEYCEKLHKELLGKNDIYGAVLALNNMVSSQISKGDFLSAEQTLNKALNTAKGHQIPTTVLAGIYTNLGIYFQNQGNYTQSLNNLNNAAEFIKGEPYPAQLADIYNTMEIEISGANNPVYILRDGAIEIIKGDKAPIGLSEDPTKKFTLKTWNAKPKDRFFLFSDGFADQFGGEFGKKLLYKNFRELIVNSGHLPLQQQNQFLDEAFLKWQGCNEQVDDVLVIGIEV